MEQPPEGMFCNLNLAQISGVGAASPEELAKRRVMSHTSWKRQVVEHEERNHYERVYHIPQRSLHPSCKSSGSGSQAATDQPVWTNPACGAYCPENREVQPPRQAL